MTTDPAIRARIDFITEETVFTHVEELCALGPRPSGDADAIGAARDHLAEKLRAMGLVVEEERFTASIPPAAPLKHKTGPDKYEGTLEWAEGERVNLLVEFRGSEEPDRILEIGAHYDSVPGTVGADDNASGVAALLEMARVLRDAPLRRTVRLCLFDLEEANLDGSAAHVENINADGSRTVEGFVSLEMLGYATDEEDSQQSPVRIPLVLYPPTQGNFITTVGNLSSGWIGNLFEAAAEAYEPDLPVYSLNRIGSWFGDAARSDHASYWRGGLDAMMLTDTANFRNPHYHRGSDTPDTLDPVFLARVTRAMTAAVLHWATD
jgi:hypothetical protein